MGMLIQNSQYSVNIDLGMSLLSYSAPHTRKAAGNAPAEHHPPPHNPQHKKQQQFQYLCHAPRVLCVGFNRNCGVGAVVVPTGGRGHGTRRGHRHRPRDRAHHRVHPEDPQHERDHQQHAAWGRMGGHPTNLTPPRPAGTRRRGQDGP